MKTSIEAVVGTAADQIAALIGRASSTFAGIEYVTEVKTAAKFKHLTITKQTRANVQLFGTLNQFTNVYKNAVMKAAKKAGENLEDFVIQDTYFEHTDCYSIVEHKTNGKQYLYCIYKKGAKSDYFIDGKAATKDDVMEFLTPSAKAAMVSSKTHNKLNDVDHDVIIRTIAIDNIVSLTAGKQTLIFQEMD